MIEHVERTHRFVAKIPEGRAFLLYARPSPGVIDFQHTEVPPEAQGQGLASKLARAAFDYARAEGLRVIPSCPFVTEWLTRHPEEHDILVDAT